MSNQEIITATTELAAAYVANLSDVTDAPARLNCNLRFIARGLDAQSFEAELTELTGVYNFLMAERAAV